MDQKFRQEALDLHQFPKPGKIAIESTKTLNTQRDLALAYSPGVAAPCEEIAKDEQNSYKYTSRGNLVAVISNGTAVLGLGAIGAAASKPVMEGKGVLFKKFAGIDVFDLEINELDPDKICDIIASLEPTFGGINLEDIKAPECFYIERKLRERMNIPVFHDDQHGTAIVVAAGILNGLSLIGKKINEVKLVTSGAGAAAIACVDLLVDLGMPASNITLCDSKGVVSKSRSNLDEDKARYTQNTNATKLAEVIAGADIFLGLSGPNMVSAEMVKSMNANPLIFALANPVPEILPEEIKAVRNDAIIATGRTDYPNQINNVLCFPFIFRGALDTGAKVINREMEIAAVKAIADLARAEQGEGLATIYKGSSLSFGPEYIIPKPFDNRLIVKVASAVAQAAMDSGVATRPILDMNAYRFQLQEFVYHSSSFMNPLFTKAKNSPRQKIIYAEGEEEKVLRAIQVVVDEGLASPILLGNKERILKNIELFGLRLLEEDLNIIDPESSEFFEQHWKKYFELTSRKGITEQFAKIEVQKRHTLVGCLMVAMGQADGLLCGTYGTHALHLQHIEQVLGKNDPQHRALYGAMNVLMLENGQQLALLDTHVLENPNATELAGLTELGASCLQSLGIEPKVALLSHSNFGTSNSSSALKMRETLQILKQKTLNFEVDGEMHGDCAIDASIRNAVHPQSELTGSANLLVFPNMDSANISFNLLKAIAGNGITLGPILLGSRKPVHILTPTASVRRIVNMTALTVIDALNQ